MNAMIRGGLAGAAATAPMTAAIAMGGGFRPGQTPPPKRIAATIARRASIRDDLPEPAFKAGWLVAHVGYGAGCGALFAAIAPHLPGPSVARGLLFGAVVWGASYGAMMPALDLYPPPSRQSRRWTALMLAAHGVYGASLGLAEQQMSSR